MTDILRSTTCEYPTVGFDPAKKFIKIWKLGFQTFKAVADGAEFFHWDISKDAKPVKVPFVVPYEVLNQTNGYPPGGNVQGLAEYPVPCDDPPVGMEVVLGWFPGTLQVKPAGQDATSFDEKVLKSLEEILTILRAPKV